MRKQIITLIGHGQWVNIARAVLLFIWWKDNFTVQIILQNNFVIMKKKYLKLPRQGRGAALLCTMFHDIFIFKRLNKNSYCTYLNMILRKINLNHFQFLEVVENHKSQCYNFDTKILYIFGRCCRNQGGWNLRMKIWVHFTRRAFTQCQILFLVISRFLLKISWNCCESHTKLYFTFSVLTIVSQYFQK